MSERDSVQLFQPMSPNCRKVSEGNQSLPKVLATSARLVLARSRLSSQNAALAQQFCTVLLEDRSHDFRHVCIHFVARQRTFRALEV